MAMGPSYNIIERIANKMHKNEKTSTNEETEDYDAIELEEEGLTLYY